MNVNPTSLIQTVSNFSTQLKHTVESCGRITKQMGRECLKTAAQVTVTVGPGLARCATPIATMLTGWAATFTLDDYLVGYSVDWKDWERCIAGLPNEQGIHADYVSNSWYPGFQKKEIQALKRAINDPFRLCADDLTQCQTCSRPDVMGGSGLLFDQTAYGIHVLLPTALGVYLSGKALNRLVGVAKQYLYNYNDSIKLGGSMEASLKENLQRLES